MRILLTGASGQVGNALQPLLRRRHTVIAPTSSEFDLSKPDKLGALLDRIRPDLIINPAAYTAVDRAEDEPARAMLINGEGPGALARWAAPRQVPIVHLSTDYVFDGRGDRAWREDDPTGPQSAYGRSKLAGEHAVRNAGGAHLVVRTAWVYAALGNNFMRTMIRLASEREVLRVVADQCGAPTSARTIAATLAEIIGRHEAGLAAAFARANGIVHLTNSGDTSWHGFASAIVKGLQSRKVALKVFEIVPIASKDYVAKAMRPANSRLDLARLKDAYGIEPPAWESALAVELDAVISL
ncbi:dTDP-4-dehydrorhamnose reductase [Bradyrhizobium sp. 38]|uniref:dTDP-4-dehydrorhamnose reductase n=1 Tax=unclassified Bradyrhizobium TaxID=2631580 RepID=UPI001FFBE836|nr:MULTISPECIES: dTDP-4-dehydrorhamnose reductase [unclassified Bradyrhizobium]MCK1341032.1 dTDP-4-dehydrorhamnose reductase [Bradyrhizobium sp. 38]MCK1780959.1 dTDP-4-dehydrorhamnose reductase [Bradyrhizobium sp. 132]